MNLSNLTKAQQKYIILFLAGSVTLVVLTVMGIKFSLSSVSAAKLELTNLTEEIKNADAGLAKREKDIDEYDKTVAQLKEYFSDLPPEKNYYSWATGIIYSTGRKSGLEIESVDEVISSINKKTEDVPIKLVSYAVRIRANGSYEEVKQFLQNLTENHPLVRITGIEISIGTHLSSHKVQAYIQWPFGLSALTKVWDEIASKQQKLFIREATKQNKAPVESSSENKSRDLKAETEVNKTAPDPKEGFEKNPDELKNEVGTLLDSYNDELLEPTAGKMASILKNETVEYVLSKKRAEILRELLFQEESTASSSLNSFFNSMLEDINV